MLNALRLNGKTLVVEADNYTIRIAGRDVKSTSAQVSTALSFAPLSMASPSLSTAARLCRASFRSR